MDKRQILIKIFNRKEVRDFTYATLFFLTSSFFIFFAIRPTLLIAFSLKRKVFDLKKMSDTYEKNISKIIKIQSELETIRTERHLIDQALPEKPEIKQLVDNIKETVSESGALIKNLTLSKIDLKKITKEENKVNYLRINMEIEGNFPVIRSFTQKIIERRRIMMVNKLRIFKRDVFSTESSQLTLEMEMDAFYL